MTDFKDKLKKLNKKVTSIEEKHLLLKNDLNKLFEVFKAMLPKRINKRFDK